MHQEEPDSSRASLCVASIPLSLALVAEACEPRICMRCAKVYPLSELRNLFTFTALNRHGLVLFSSSIDSHLFTSGLHVDQCCLLKMCALLKFSPFPAVVVSLRVLCRKITPPPCRVKRLLCTLWSLASCLQEPQELYQIITLHGHHRKRLLSL